MIMLMKMIQIVYDECIHAGIDDDNDDVVGEQVVQMFYSMVLNE